MIALTSLTDCLWLQGIVIGFLLHEMALLPQVASATVTLITLFTCGSNALQFLLRDMLPLDYAAVHTPDIHLQTTR